MREIKKIFSNWKNNTFLTLCHKKKNIVVSNLASVNILSQLKGVSLSTEWEMWSKTPAT